MKRLGLQLNISRTRIVHARNESFDLLGFSFRVFKGRKTGRFYPHVQPSKQSVQMIKDRMKRLTSHRRTTVPLSDVMDQVNWTLRGWILIFTIEIVLRYSLISSGKRKRDYEFTFGVVLSCPPEQKPTRCCPVSSSIKNME